MTSRALESAGIAIEGYLANIKPKEFYSENTIAGLAIQAFLDNIDAGSLCDAIQDIMRKGILQRDAYANAIINNLKSQLQGE